MIVMVSFTRIATFSLSEYSSTRSGQTVSALRKIRIDQSGAVKVTPLEGGWVSKNPHVKPNFPEKEQDSIVSQRLLI